MRISFLGGGTDLAAFYKRSPGRVISTTIDQYVHVVINRTPLINKVAARYSVSETVNHPKQLHNTRIKAALIDKEIFSGIEIASFADLPSRTGLGSSSSFSVALMKGLAAYQGKKLTKEETAEEAARLEIDLLHEPIGKQDQYASSLGGFNIFQFNQDGSVSIEPILLDFRKRIALEEHLLLFFTGITRDASSILTDQKANTEKDEMRFNTLKEMAYSVDEFSEKLLKGNFQGLGRMLHNGWVMKKSLTNKISSPFIDELYEMGLDAGAWGGKLLGAGGGGCIMFISPISTKDRIRKKMYKVAKKYAVADFQELPIKFVQSGAEIQMNTQ